MSSNGTKILVVDDDRDIVRALNIRLRQAGYEVASAFDGYEAVHSAHSEAPDLILLDIQMPAGDGFSVLERLRVSVETSQIPVVFLTANPQTANWQKALEMGAVDFIPKPYEGKELLRVVKRALGHVESDPETVL
jgi:DNA-binding response OmpR family regulator